MREGVDSGGDSREGERGEGTLAQQQPPPKQMGMERTTRKSRGLKGSHGRKRGREKNRTMASILLSNRCWLFNWRNRERVAIYSQATALQSNRQQQEGDDDGLDWI